METNWGRLFNQFRPTGFFIISASRKENSPEVNKRKTLKLKKELEDKCFRPIAVHGGWVEDEGLDTEKFVNETSFFVPLFFGNKQFSASQYDVKSTHIFYKWIFELGRRYEQESVLYCPPNGKPRYVQTTEKDYGEGPIKAGTHFDRFNRVNHNQKDAKYYTDLVNPKYQGGYNQETGKFMKSPKRITFESLENSFKRVMKLTEDSRIDPSMKVGNSKFYYPAERKNSLSRYTFEKPSGTVYLKVLKYIVDNPGCKRNEALEAAGLRPDTHQGLFQNMSNEEFFRITTKGEYFPTKKGIDFVKKHFNKKDYNSGYKPAQFVFDEPYILDTESFEYAWDYESMLDFLNNSSPEFTDNIEDYKDLEDYDNLKDWWDAHYDKKGMAMTSEYHSSLRNDVKDCIDGYNASRKVKNGEYPKIGNIATYGEENGFCWINVDASDWSGEENIDELEDELLYNLRSAPAYGVSYGEENEEDYKTGFDEDSGIFSFCWKTDILKAGAL